MADPSTLQRDGKNHVKTSLNIPQTSKELRENSEEYHLLTNALKPIFEWIPRTGIIFISAACNFIVQSSDIFLVEEIASRNI